MAYGKDRTAIAVTILNGGTISSEVNVGAKRIVGIQMPAAWTAGNITLQALVSQPAGLPAVPVFAAVSDGAGAAIVVAATPAAGSYVALADTLALFGLGRVKVVAGAAQGAQRDFFLVCIDG